MTVVVWSLLVFLLCISLHSCNARRLGDLAINKELEKNVHISSKDNEKESLTKIISSVPPKFKSSTSKELRHTTKGDDDAYIKGSHQAVEETTTKLKDSKGTIRKLLKGLRGKISGDAVVQKESHGSVSWRVPHKKRGERQPWFNLDYSPPKTHPPHHN